MFCDRYYDLSTWKERGLISSRADQAYYVFIPSFVPSLLSRTCSANLCLRVSIDTLQCILILVSVLY